MNDKFYSLTEEKQRNIINAAMEVFGINDYRHAITEDIARKAGISKGLLFHYFKNKKELYLFIYQYCIKVMVTMIQKEELEEIHDFFDILMFGASKKLEILCQYPYIMEFAMRAYYSQNQVNEEIRQDIEDKMGWFYSQFFSHMDVHKFKEDVDPFYVLQMMQWMADGYMNALRSSGKHPDFQEMMKEYQTWIAMFRPMVYKSEYV